MSGTSPYAYQPLPSMDLHGVLQLLQLMGGSGGNAGSTTSPMLALIQQLMGQHANGGSSGGGGGNALQSPAGAPQAFPAGSSNLYQPPASDPTMSFGPLAPPQGAGAPASVGDWRTQQGANALQGQGGDTSPWASQAPPMGPFGGGAMLGPTQAPLWSLPGANFPQMGAMPGVSGGFPGG